MAFTSFEFFVFLLISIVAFYIVPKKLKTLILLFISYWFYSSQGIIYVLLLLFATAVTWLVGKQMVKTENKKLAFIIGASPLLISLCAFKYYNFIALQIATVFGMELPKLTLLAPLGISFYTFQSLGYLIDIYQNVAQSEKNFLRYAVFVSFFPCISSGPIERGENLLPQINSDIKYDYNNVATGATRVLLGFFKKYVIAENLAIIVDKIYGAPFTGHPQAQNFGGPFLLMAALIYSYQLYCDFSGYTDIAIGTAKMLGFNIMENFKRPFSAKSYTELWDKWHISLTSWFRDYIFTPLTMKSIGRENIKMWGYFNIFVVFLISGLWHGSAWTYVLWGAMNGVYMVVEKYTAKKRRKLAKKNVLYKNKMMKNVIQIGIVYLLFTSCIIFFRASTIKDGIYIYTSLLGGWGSIIANPKIITDTFTAISLGFDKILWLTFLIVGVEVLDMLAEKSGNTTAEFILKQNFFVRTAIYYICLGFLAFVGVFGGNSFIYFAF